MTDVRTYTASDDRNVKSADGKGYHYPSSNREGHVSEKNETFVSEAISILTTFRKRDPSDCGV